MHLAAFLCTMIKLSVNINKIATIRNARGGNTPDIVKAAEKIESYGAHGITVHPRPDERHIRYQDVYDLKKTVQTELNVEGNPTKDFVKMVLQAKPHQVTLVPDAPDALTSNAGWDTIKHTDFLKEVIAEFKSNGIRTSIFVDPIEAQIEGAKRTGTDRVELYTESFALKYNSNRDQAILPYKTAALVAQQLELGVNAGHDLSLENLRFFAEQIPFLEEVSIGHALISDALYFGLDNTVKMYLHQLNPSYL
jgi:pyridoxine 5-phosphate synthase